MSARTIALGGPMPREEVRAPRTPVVKGQAWTPR